METMMIWTMSRKYKLLLFCVRFICHLPELIWWSMSRVIKKTCQYLTKVTMKSPGATMTAENENKVKGRQSNEDITFAFSPWKQHLHHLTRLLGGKFGREANISYAASNDLCSGKCTSPVGPNLSICTGPTLIKESWTVYLWHLNKHIRS